MILLKSLIVLLLLLIIAHIVKVGWGKKTQKEGFENEKVDEINSYYNSNIANDLESPNSLNVPVVQNTVLGGELAPAIGVNTLTPSQKVHSEAKMQQMHDENKTVGKHKKVSDNALNMNYLKGQMEELVKLGNEAQIINENFKSIAK
jgi:hypothetical protein